MSFAGNIAHGLMKHLSRKDFRQFFKYAGNPGFIQEAYLLSLLQRNAGTEFGRKHYFSKIRSIEDYQHKIPVRKYEDFQLYIDQIASGNHNILTTAPVQILVPTSGTTGFNKFIPYTRDTVKEFNRALHVWIHGLYLQYPGLKNGRAFWIISPWASLPFKESVVPVGFVKDESYFGKSGSCLINQTMVLPPGLQQIENAQIHMHAMCLYMLAADDLNLISVWNPTYLLVLLQYIVSNKSLLLQDLSTGSFSSAGLKIKPDKTKALLLEKVIIANETARTSWNIIWPRLQLISCWNHAWAASQVDAVQKLFAGIPIQGKGLLATEGAVTIPFREFHLPAFFSHFFEFENVDGGKMRLLHQLEKGHTYDTILTTGSGLYRYRMNDLVRVTGFYRGLPSLEFIGKSNVVSDLVGEKLSEPVVNVVLQVLRQEFAISTRVLFLSPCTENGMHSYTLFTEEENPDPLLSLRLDEELKKGIYYAHARSCNQLSQPRIYTLNKQGTEQFTKLQQAGQQGTTKLLSLNLQHNLHTQLIGKFR
jgi:hypothetical protein